MWMAYLFSCLLTAISIFFTTAKASAVPEISSSSQLMPANALTGSTTAIMQTLGGALGGIATQVLGYQTAFVINALSFVASAFLIYQIQFRNQVFASKEGMDTSSLLFVDDLQKAITFVRSQDRNSTRLNSS